MSGDPAPDVYGEFVGGPLDGVERIVPALDGVPAPAAKFASEAGPVRYGAVTDEEPWRYEQIGE